MEATIRFQGLGLRGWGIGLYRAKALGLRVKGLECRV